ncbi:RNA-directed DNA polymerase reverse transcriptase family protein [Gossypium australe]|uniref:RNA-directed DNA polymerase reverse transcriptase family protein n=1 Tax=Gossypium australe TaxID=47621 RepID=A0A5B6VDB5_9ROSI|nr:RNA-directed DNA polymerase reverse transcriptase family protein [Gossypium australe]
MIAKFWWCNAHTKKGIHWCQWRKVCRPKGKGGLNYLFAKVMKAKYYSNIDFMNAKLGSYPSYTWSRIWTSRRLLE